jgi:O-antigen/teichoic acid export membrane protein
MTRGAAVLAGGQGIGQVFSLVRNIVIARVLSPADFGVAALFAITVTFLEMISYLAVDKLIIQAEDGDSIEMQATAHTFQAGRGAVLGLLLLALAGPITVFFDVPAAKSAFMWLALIPLLRGLLHLDSKRLHRSLVFGPSVVVDALPKVLSAAAAWPVAAAIGDYTAVVWLLVGQTTLMTLLSHVVAKRSYWLGWNRPIVVRLARFGWPLLLNGLVMFGIMQGDGVIVGHWYTKTELGVYMAALMLMMQPTGIIGSTASFLFLPVLSQAQRDEAMFRKRLSSTAQWTAAAALAVSLPLMTLGALLVPLLYGHEYAAAGTFVVYLAAMQGIRILRMVPTIGALAKANSRASLYTNLVRSLAIGIGIAAAAWHGPLWWIALSGLVGELSAYSFAVIYLRVVIGVPVLVCAGPGMLAVVCMGVAGVAMGVESDQIAPLYTILVSMALTGLGALVVFLGCRHVRQDLMSAFRSFRDRSQTARHSVST